MAFASSLQKGQIPVGCELCKGQKEIKFKCIECELLMCSECLDRVHLRIAKDHQITDIKEIGKRVTFSEIKCENHTGQTCCLFCQTCKTFICLKCVAKVHTGHQLIEEEEYNEGKVKMKPKKQGKIKFEISKEYTTDLNNVKYIAVCSDGSMWMGDNTNTKLQHVKFRKTRAKVKTSLKTHVWGIATTHSNDILVITDKTNLQIINTMTGQMTDSRYDVKPLLPISIHVTSDHRVTIGAWTGGKVFPATGRRVVVVLDQEGKQLQEYEHDSHNKQLFTYPGDVTTTSSGNLCVVDNLGYNGRGRVVVLSPRGEIVGIYTGHPDVNKGRKPFIPQGILATPSDNIVVTDMNTDFLHLLTNKGQSITYYNLRDMGIIFPSSLALSTSGTIYIGCVSEAGSPNTTTSKLHELEYSGI